MLPSKRMTTPTPAPFDLVASARAEMIHDGFHVFLHDSGDSPEGAAEVAQIRSVDVIGGTDLRDERDKLWSSIDNDTSKDLDQIEVAERVAGGIKMRVAIGDVALLECCIAR